MPQIDVPYRVHQLFRAQALTGGASAVLSPRFPVFGASAVVFSAKTTNSVVPSALGCQINVGAPGGTMLVSSNAAILDNWGLLPNLTPADMSSGFQRAISIDVPAAGWGSFPFLLWTEMLFTVTPHVTVAQDTVIDLDAIVFYNFAPRDGGGRTLAGAPYFKDLYTLGLNPV